MIFSCEISFADSGDAVRKIMSFAIETGLKIAFGLIFLFLGFRFVNLISRRINRSKKHDKTITRSLAYVVRIGGKILICLSLIGILGLDTGGITALIASVGVSIGLAVNGTLSNLAGGVIIVVTRPFKIDDYIEAQGVSGTVEDIRMVCTRVRTPDNKVVYIPNGALANGNIINYSEKTERRIDFVFPLDPACNQELAKRIIRDVCAAEEGILPIPDVLVTIQENSEKYLKILARVWVKSENYWDVYYRITENAHRTLTEQGITVPRERLDVRISKSEE